MVKAYLALGSNVGDRKARLRAALTFLEDNKDIKVEKASSLYESEPVGPVKQGNFYNMVVEIGTNLAPEALLKTCQLLEQRLKRKKTVRWGPRTIDLDILLYDSLEVNLEELIIPHPEMKNRAFVLVPLLEIAPEAKLPSGKTLRNYLSLLPPESHPHKIGTFKL